MFKAACPRSYSYAYDDATSTFTCAGGDYTMTFCPSSPKFRLCNVTSFVDRIKLGHWPVLSSSDITLELVDSNVSDDEARSVFWSARFDGPGEGVSALAHLASLKFLTLRLVQPSNQGLLSPRVRVEMLQQTFDACDSLLENTRQIWKKSMIHVMSWLRPEVMTSEAKYGTRLTVNETER